MGRRPRLLVLDEPTASLGVQESAQVEELIMNLREQGTTILLACHDIDQMFRLADRIVVLRQGRILADLRPADTHPDDVVALLSGQTIDSTARRQLTRLHGLTDRLVSADPGSSLSLILSALGAALSTERLLHSPGQRQIPVLCRVPRLHPRRAGTVGPAAVRAPAVARWAWPRPTNAR
jgi:ABC-type proline/glycine betaine transport system ATPase subunit